MSSNLGGYAAYSDSFFFLEGGVISVPPVNINRAILYPISSVNNHIGMGGCSSLSESQDACIEVCVDPL